MSAVACLTVAIALAAQSPSVHGRSRTTIVVGSQPMFSLESRSLQLQRFAPIIEELSIRAETGVEGLRVVTDAWGVIDAGDQFSADRAVADLLEAYLEWRTKNVELRAGRLFLFSDVGRGKRIDGGSFALRGRIDAVRLGAETWVGAPVSTLYGQEPLAGTLPNAADDPLFFAARGSDWLRPGDFAFGARVDGAVLDVLELGGGYVHERDLDEIDREALIGRFHLAPVPELALDGFGSFDVYAGALEDAELSLAVRPLANVRAAIYGRTRIPGLTLASTSIFSVFASEEHAELGVEADWFVARRTRLSASAEVRRTALADDSDEALGYRLTAGVRSGLAFWPGARTALSYERLSDGWYGHYDYLRASAEFPMSEEFSLAPDAGVFLVGRTGDDSAVAGRVGLAGSLRVVRDLLVVIAGRGTRNADGGGELALIGRIEWNVEHTF